MRYSYIYEARMSPALNGSSVVRRFEGNDVIEICDGITFNFYTGLPHICIYIMSSPSQRVVPCSVGEMDSAIQRHIKGGAVVICTSTAQEAKRLLQVNWQ